MQSIWGLELAMPDSVMTWRCRRRKIWNFLAKSYTYLYLLGISNLVVLNPYWAISMSTLSVMNLALLSLDLVVDINFVVYPNSCWCKELNIDHGNNMKMNLTWMQFWEKKTSWKKWYQLPIPCLNCSTPIFLSVWREKKGVVAWFLPVISKTI